MKNHDRLCVSVVLCGLSFFITSPCRAQVVVRVVDVGAGLCCVAKTPDDHYMIYDAGNYRDRGYTAMVAIDDIIPNGSEIDLMVLSHCDADHLAAVPYICENYTVKEVWRDGFDPGTQTFGFADQAIADEVTDEGCTDINLQSSDVGPGFDFALGDQATVTFLCGFGTIPSDWGLSGGENKNARSIVVRLDHGGASMMFAGDTVGRHIGSDWNTLIAAERFLVENSSSVPLDVDVVVAPHHGADNGSSWGFIQATRPDYVIFSAGHHFNHPRYWTANRYQAGGVDPDNMFRTDRGDNEGTPEWFVHGGDSADEPGDDDIEIQLHLNGTVDVTYLRPDGQIDEAFAPTDLPDRIRKYLEADEMWTETHEGLEDHTMGPEPQQPMAQAIPPTSIGTCQPAPACCCQKPAFRRRMLVRMLSRCRKSILLNR